MGNSIVEVIAFQFHIMLQYDSKPFQCRTPAHSYSSRSRSAPDLCLSPTGSGSTCTMCPDISPIFERRGKSEENFETRKNSLQLDVSVGHGHVCVWVIDVPERSCWGTTGGKTNWFNCIKHQFLLKWFLELTNLDIVGTAKSNVWKTAHLMISHQL